MTKKYILHLATMLIFCNSGFSQKLFTRADTLRGSNGFGRQQWDVLHYNITVQPNFDTKTLLGKNIIVFADRGTTTMQIDLQEPMTIDSIFNKGEKLAFTREGNVFWLLLRSAEDLKNFKPANDSLIIYFSGKPRAAKMPPWDGGWIWKKDKNDNPWMSVACQGLGASVWYPCKDIQSDEPDNGAKLSIIVPDTLVGIGNGRMISTGSPASGLKSFTWSVKSPINNYNIVPYIGKYVHFGETYKGEKGNLSMDYWVLDYNLDKAKTHFAEAPKMMKALEYWFGPYPFYEDGYKLVESPHLGMEHQSNIAYGNAYKTGYLGRDMSGSGWGDKWDFIIVHESGHEWYGNNITSKDIADMWVHEGFTNYSETLYTDFHFGVSAGNAYLQGLRGLIRNNTAIIGPYGVNEEGSGDMYYKGGNLLHTIRQIMGDDSFRKMLRAMNKDFYHSTVTSAEIESYISKFAGKDLQVVFDQYLRSTLIPEFQYKKTGKDIQYRFANCLANFTMPLKVNGKWLNPTTSWKKIACKALGNSIEVDNNFYIIVKKL